MPRATGYGYGGLVKWCYFHWTLRPHTHRHHDTHVGFGGPKFLSCGMMGWDEAICRFGIPKLLSTDFVDRRL